MQFSYPWSYTITPSSEGNEAKVITLGRDFLKLVMLTSLGICDGKGRQEEETRNILQVCTLAENVSTQPHLKRGERIIFITV